MGDLETDPDAQARELVVKELRRIPQLLDRAAVIRTGRLRRGSREAADRALKVPFQCPHVGQRGALGRRILRWQQRVPAREAARSPERVDREDTLVGQPTGEGPKRADIGHEDVNPALLMSS